MKKGKAAMYVFLFFLCILFCVRAEDVIYAAKDALILCGERVVPSLFPFFVLSSFMVSTGFVNAFGWFFSPFAKRVFRVSGNGAVVFLMGLLCGYPTGAKMISELYRENQITKEEAHRLLPFCNNAGPLFVMGAVGSMLGDFYAARVIFIIHATSAFLVGILFSFGAKKVQKTKSTPFCAISLGEALSESLSGAVKTMLLVCGYIIFFAVLRAFLSPLIFKLFGKNALSLFLNGMLEVTLGAKEICVAGLFSGETFVLLSAIVGFGGVCVLLQVWGIVSRAGLSVKNYLFGKLLQMGISALLALVFFRFFKTVPVFCPAAISFKPFPDIGVFLFFAALIVCAIDKGFTVWYINERKKGRKSAWQKKTKYPVRFLIL